MSSILNNIHKNSLFIIISQVVNKVAGFLAVYVLARYLSVEDYGTYNLIVGSLIVSSFFTNFGLASSLQRFLPEYARFENNEQIVNTVLFGQIFRAVTGIMFCAVTIGFFPSFSVFFKIEGYYTEYILFCIASYFFFQIEYLLISCIATFHHKYSTISQTCFLLLRVFLILLFLLNGYGLKYVFISEIISYFVGFLILEFYFINEYKIKLATLRNISFKNLEWKRITKFSAFSALTIPGNFLFSYSLDFFVIASLANPYSLGIYSLASRVSQTVFNLLPNNFFQTIIRPVFFQKYYSDIDKENSLSSMFQLLLKVTSITNFGILAVVLATSTEILDILFANKYSESVIILNIVIIFGIFRILELPSDLVIQTIEKVHLKLYLQIIAIYNLVAAIVLMKYYDIIGVAIATSSAMALKSILLFILAKRHTKIKLPYRHLSIIIGISMITYILIKLSLSYFDYKLAFIIIGSLGLLFYSITVYFLNAFTTKEKLLLNRLFKFQLFRINEIFS